MNNGGPQFNVSRRSMIQIEDDNKSVVSETPSLSTSLAARVARLSEEDRCTFMDEMHSFGEDMDFQAT